ncbi:single-strand binding protein [human gut metagenome]|uniref:Single-strand binding protein n=1 Tax=human gut metagenome TaxID=408170 RepID=K1TWW5_9ZZZZ
MDKGTQQQGQPYPFVRISDERRLILVDGTLSSSLWKDKNGESQIQLSITAESIAFINTGRREGAAAGEDNAVSGADGAPVPPADFPQDEKEDLPF